MDERARVFLRDREKHRAGGDMNMVHALDVELERIGYKPPAHETTTASAQTLATAAPAKARRGRRPKPRCEHGNIPDRCDACQVA